MAPCQALRNSRPLGQGCRASGVGGVGGQTAGRTGREGLSAGAALVPLLCGRPFGSPALDNGSGVRCGCRRDPRGLRLWLGNNTQRLQQDLHSDVWGVGVALFFSGDRFVQCWWRCFCSFFPALGNTGELVVLFPKLSQFLTLLLQFILQL